SRLHSAPSLLFSSITRPPPRPTLFPYTTLFRSSTWARCARSRSTARISPPPGRPRSPRRARTRSSPPAPIAATSCLPTSRRGSRSEEHTSELQSPCNLVCRLLLEKKKKNKLDKIHFYYIHDYINSNFDIDTILKYFLYNQNNY